MEMRSEGCTSDQSVSSVGRILCSNNNSNKLTDLLPHINHTYPCSDARSRLSQGPDSQGSPSGLLGCLG